MQSKHNSFLSMGMMVLLLGLVAGQNCQQPLPSRPATPEKTPNYALISACGLSATECVPLAGTSPIALAATDLDGDTDLDLVVANFGTDTITLLLNNGDKTFSPTETFAAGENPGSIEAGDFDGDGDFDFASTGGFAVSLFTNDGTGTFPPTATEIDLEDAPSYLVAADLDNDGDLDLATANGAFERVSILINPGDGQFTVDSNVSLGNTLSQLNSIDAADLNNDGWLDLAICRRFGDSVAVLINNGDGTFASPVDTTISSGHILNSVKAAELDGVGGPDLIIADNGDPFDEADQGHIEILLNDGTGRFASRKRIVTGDSPVFVAPADYDNDGDIDLVVANNMSDSISLLLNDGGAIFVIAEEVGVGQGPNFVTAADLDGDGWLDLAVSNISSNSISILLNDGTGSFAVN